MKNVLGAFSRIVRPITKLFAVKFRRISKFSACEFYRNSSGRNYTIYVSKNEAVCREVQMHSGSSFPINFTDTVLDVIPRFMCLKTKRFAVKFRRILEVL